MPSQVISRKLAGMGKKFVLSLGSGGLRGYVHLGVYKALYENDIKIDAIYGCSVGALIGAFISEGWHPDKLIGHALKITPLGFIDLAFPNNGYIVGKKLNAHISHHIQADKLEDLPIPLTVVATKTLSGEAEYFQKGPVAECIQASCSIPNVFRPVLIGGTEYLDGDLCSPVPIRKAREDYGKNAVILAVNVIPDASVANRSSKKWADLISRTIYRQTLVAFEKPFADLYLNPILGYGVKYSKSESLKRIEIGYRQTIAIIPRLKQILAPV